MAKPTQESRLRSYLEDVEVFYEAFQALGNDRKLWRKFMKDLLTESEMRMIKRRWHVARLLVEGRTIRETAAMAGVGTDTVSRVSKTLRSGTGTLRQVLTSLRKQTKERHRKTKPLHWIFGGVKE